MSVKFVNRSSGMVANAIKYSIEVSIGLFGKDFRNEANPGVSDTDAEGIGGARDPSPFTWVRT